MAELAKMLHFLKSGTEQTAKAYSTTDEAGDNYVPLKIDGVACYAPLGATDDAMATNGRVIKGGTTYAIKSQAKPPYAEIKYTTAGTYTFTVPTGVTRLRVAVCGGGGGGADEDWYCANFGYKYAGNGGDSSFSDLLVATGGNGGIVNVKNAGEDSIISGSTVSGGTPNGNSGERTQNTGKTSGGSGFSLSFTKTSGTYGKGGDAYSGGGGASSGGSGGYNSGYITVESNKSYSVTVGSGGSAYNGNGGATEGNSGFVFIAYGGDI